MTQRSPLDNLSKEELNKMLNLSFADIGRQNINQFNDAIKKTADKSVIRKILFVQYKK